jgi:hypothetical protein
VDCAAAGGECRSRTITVEIDRTAGGPPALDVPNPSDPDHSNCLLEAVLASAASDADSYTCTRARCVRP